MRPVTGHFGGGCTRGGRRRIPASRLPSCRGNLQQGPGPDRHDPHGDPAIPEHVPPAHGRVLNHPCGQRPHEEGSQTQAYHRKPGCQGSSVRPPLGRRGNGWEVDEATAKARQNPIGNIKLKLRLNEPGQHKPDSQNKAARHDHLTGTDLIADSACGKRHQPKDQTADREGQSDLGTTPTEFRIKRLNEHAPRIEQHTARGTANQSAQ